MAWMADIIGAYYWFSVAVSILSYDDDYYSVVDWF